jgi:AraC-like DNA-binding protein
MSTRLVVPIVHYLERTGWPADPLLARAELSRSELASPGARVPHARVMRFWELAAAETGDRQLGLHVARHVEPGVMDLIEYLARCSATLGEALERTSAYFRLLHDRVSFLVERSGEQVILRNAVPPGLPTTPVYVENALAATLVMARRMTRQPIPVDAVFFRHAAPPQTAEYCELFGGPVTFGAPADAALIPRACLDAPLLQADSALASILERHVQLLLGSGPPGPRLQDRVARLLGAQLAGGELEAAQIARRLGMSPRTLRRLLRAEGSSFRELLTEVRRALALRYLQDPQVPLGEVAFLVGFTDASAFHRAFRRWTGRPPGAFRAAAAAARPRSQPQRGRDRAPPQPDDATASP